MFDLKQFISHDRLLLPKHSFYIIIFIMMILSGCRDDDLVRTFRLGGNDHRSGGIFSEPKTELSIVGGGTLRAIGITAGELFRDNAHTWSPRYVDPREDVPADISALPPWYVQVISGEALSHSERSSYVRRSKGVCGGVLIDERSILTARHCLYPMQHGSHIYGISEEFKSEHYRTKVNFAKVGVFLPFERGLDRVEAKPGQFTIQAHDEVDLAIITSNSCRFFDPSSHHISGDASYHRNAVQLPVRSLARYSSLRAYGSGGTMAPYRDNMLIPRMTAGLSGLHPTLIPELLLDSAAPSPLISTVEICAQLKNLNCLPDGHICHSVALRYPNMIPNPSLHHSSQQCSKEDADYLWGLLRINQKLISLNGESWPEIFEDDGLPGLKGTFFVYDSRSRAKSSREKGYFCDGDSGGPVVNERNELVGILSSHTPSRLDYEPQYPHQACVSNMYAVDVPAYQDWITRALERSRLDQPEDSSPLPLCVGLAAGHAGH